MDSSVIGQIKPLIASGRARTFGAIAACSAVVTFLYFDRYSSFSTEEGRRIFAGIRWVFTCVALSSPLFAAISAIFAAFRWRVGFLAIAECHAALFTAVMVVEWATFIPHHASPADTLADIAMGLLKALLIIELAAFWTAVRRNSDRRTGNIFIGLTAALIAGWALGLLAWSEHMPVKITLAAEQTAAGAPYCLETSGQPSKSARDLTAIAMKSSSIGSRASDFYVLLVIEGSSEHQYMNWSYYSGRFEPVSQKARAGLHLDREVRCKPAPHFTNGWR